MGVVNLIVYFRFSPMQSNFIWQKKQMQLRLWMRYQEWDSKNEYDVAKVIIFMRVWKDYRNAAYITNKIK